MPLNSIQRIIERVRRGRRLVIKRRNGYSEPLAELANVYFRMTGIQIHFWSKTKEWQQELVDNVIYDEKKGRARLIDFEIVHGKSLPTKSRHADDLLVFSFRFDGLSAQPAMAYSGIGVPPRVRQCAGHCTIEE